MRRLAAAAAGAIAVVIALVTVAASGGGSQDYRVDAIFDNADYLVGGQQVKIAGAVAGDVTKVRLTPDHRARVEMEVQRDFAPFRSDASCEIRPESLIGEKFVQCYPGSPRGRPLTATAAGAPTVPLAQNHSPVDVDLVLGALRLPFRERLSLLVSELGTGLAGRPADLEAAILRASPALQQTHRVLSMLAADRRTVGELIDASNRVIGELARRRGDVASFIDRADTVAGAFARRRGELGDTIHRLPPLLDQLTPAATELAGFSREALPVSADLRAAAAPLHSLLGDVAPLTSAALPVLVKVDELAVTGRHAVRVSLPVAAKLAPVASALPPIASLVRDLLASVRARGAVEALERYFYFGAESLARFDKYSHIFPSYQVSLPSCQQFASQPVAACDAHWKGGSATATAAGGNARAGAERRSSRAAAPAPAPAAASAPVPSTPAPAPKPGDTSPPTPVQQAQQLLSFLVGP